MTQEGFFGRAGQPPPFRLNFTYDDASHWTWSPQSWNKNALGLVSSPLVHSLPYFYSEDAFWLGSSICSYSVILATTQAKFFGQPGQAPPFRWNATYGDSSFWSWTGTTRNRNILFPTISPLVYPPSQWYGEDAFWQGVPTRSQIISL